jgi:hypothetical protein
MADINVPIKTEKVSVKETKTTAIPRLKVSQIIAEVEEQHVGSQRVSQIIAEVEWQLLVPTIDIKEYLTVNDTSILDVEILVVQEDLNIFASECTRENNLNIYASEVVGSDGNLA